ncbi:hypothetical protein J537_2756 [Acinetobacter baumannii 1437282]|nr:hypothetical protein J537_2756 [Acinetobacter baumannii 1437282]
MENALLNFEFLEGDYYKFNDSEYRYDDMSSLKIIIEVINKIIFNCLPEMERENPGNFELKEFLIVICDVLEKFKDDRNEKKYLKEIIFQFANIRLDPNLEGYVHNILTGLSEVKSKAYDFFLDNFTDIHRYFLIFKMANNSYKLGELSKYENRLNGKLRKELEKNKKELALIEGSKQNKPAVQLYDEINKDFLKLEEKYRWLFISTIISTLVLTIGYDPLLGIGGNFLSLACSLNSSWIDACATLTKPSLYPFNGDTLKFVMFKLTVLIVGVTLTTYFLRLSGFYQLKQEQAKQTKLELSAFPDFVSGMDLSVANNLRQELALKYFGKEIDKTMIEKNGDLFQEQIKVGTELIKASAEMVKTVKPTTAKEEDSEAKAKNKNE